MTTIEALPGLIRKRSPGAVGDLSGTVVSDMYAVCGIDVVDVYVEGHDVVTWRIADMSLDLDDPTGLFHLRLWVAERVGLDASGGAELANPYRACWFLNAGGKMWSFRDDSITWANVGGDDTQVPALAGITDPAEALKAIALHLHAGGEG